MTDAGFYMQRCFQLAEKGLGAVAPNPVVGAVLVHNGRIIGEGYHRHYGEPHAEVNAIRSVREADRHLIPESTIYVSLEPCAHHGKTPPCADLLIRERVKEVVIANRDPFPDVNGKGIEKLKAAGIKVTVGVEEAKGWQLNRRFFTFHTKHRPYVVLKWAQTADGFIGSADNERMLISDQLTNRLVHQWRSNEAGILVGRKTAAADNPKLDNRFWSGRPPVRLILDPNLKLPPELALFDRNFKTIVLNLLRGDEKGSEHLLYKKINPELTLPAAILKALYEEKLQSVLIEGGRETLQSFIDAGLWDEMRVITNTGMLSGKGVPAPVMGAAALQQTDFIRKDKIEIFRPV